MNKKENILDAWITIEQLSEGSINKKDKSLISLDEYEKQEDFRTFFLEFITKKKEENKVSDKLFEKSGIIIYFNIFDFQEVVDLLRAKYRITQTEEEVSNSHKFTFALCFDNQLNLVADKVFYTMSGYIRRYGDFPKEFLKFENSFREKLNREFSEEFNATISRLLQEYNADKENLRYAFVKNLENGDANLHSFFIEDLNKAMTVTNENLDRYFKGFSGIRKNLDGKKESSNFNPHIFEENILQPKLYPLGRFPSNPEYALSFMQQVAVNLALNDKNDIRSVNGPPGTGKTTLLKDIFADLVVQQALEIVKMSNKKMKGSLVYWQHAKFAILPMSISEKNIIVASSNNGAVQNIVKELPKKLEIANEFQHSLAEADYFKDIANSKLKSKGFGKHREIESELSEEDKWGVFSLEGGTASNINHLLLTIEAIENDLEENYQDNPDTYREFLSFYSQVENKREEIQRCSEEISRLQKLKNEWNQASNTFEEEKTKKQKELRERHKEKELDREKLIQENIRIDHDVLMFRSEMNNLTDLQSQAERNYDVIISQKPSFLWVQRLFNKSNIEEYFNDLNHANDYLNHISEQKTKLRNDVIQCENEKRKNQELVEYSLKQVQVKQTNFEQWSSNENKRLKKLESKINELERNKSKNDTTGLDFSLSYDKLQKSNPWSTKEFRELQSQLFISALRVRKQFLYENKKQLKTARMIWSKQSEYIGKENGEQLISESWQWLNFTIPIISTTFASFGRMFKNLNENAIGNLFIDEAGQALPQASVGAIFRSKKVMVVGDPSQIKPVVTLDSNVLNLIGRHFQVDEKFVSSDASTQTLVDDASQFGFQKRDEEWIGIPLWVHRRSNDPMFTIANEISYDGLMVQGKPGNAKGKSCWYISTGKANDKFVKEQGELLKNLIEKRLQEDPDLANEIYVISPFKNVARNLVKTLDEIKFTRRENGKVSNIGTVHTFQGKEARIVYFVLGADSTSSGAASWAVSDPNMMNVAATRAKEEFYIIGDKTLYASLGSKVADTTISIIDNYNV